jgi:CheY-like chemotaxis protein
MKKRSILYVDDDPDDREYFQESFEGFAEEFDLFLFEDALELIHHLDHTSSDQLPSLIVVDINMPRLNGYDALKIIRLTKEHANIPAMLFSTTARPFDEEFGRKYKAGFLSKPSNSKQMAEVIAQLLAHASVK